MTPVKLPKRREYGGKKPSGNRRPSASAPHVPSAARAIALAAAGEADRASRRAVGALTVFLPFPPSVNNLFNNVGKRRVPTKRYMAWVAEAGAALLASGAHQIRVSGDVRVEIVLAPPDKRRRDLDNLGKAPLDLIVKHGLIEDDSKVVDLRIRWRVQHAPCSVRIATVGYEGPSVLYVETGE